MCVWHKFQNFSRVYIILLLIITFLVFFFTRLFVLSSDHFFCAAIVPETDFSLTHTFEFCGYNRQGSEEFVNGTFLSIKNIALLDRLLNVREKIAKQKMRGNEKLTALFIYLWVESN